MKMILTFIFRKMINHFRTLPRYSVNARQYLKLCRSASILFLFNSFSWQRQRIDDDCNNVIREKLFWVLKILVMGQFDTADNLTPRTIWHWPCKEDNLTLRTIWHRGQFDTIINFIFLQLFGPELWLEIYWLSLSIFLTKNYPL